MPPSVPCDDEAATHESRPLAPGPGVLPAGMVAVGSAGAGTFCEVWCVRRRRDRARFALKLAKPEWSDRPEARAVLQREARIGLAVGGRYVMRVVEARPAGPRPSLIAEWVPGGPLESLLRGGRPLEIATAAWIGRQCVSGLLELAECGYAHGDLKPANVMVAPDGAIKLIDLGSARPLSPRRAAGAENWLVPGTAEYLAPETVCRRDFDPIAADLYSLGVVLYRLLSGRLPFIAESTSELIRLHRSHRPEDVRRRRPETPPVLAGLIRRLLAKEPLRRPASLLAVARTLIEVELSQLARGAAGSHSESGERSRAVREPTAPRRERRRCRGLRRSAPSIVAAGRG